MASGKKEANEPFRLVTVTSTPSRITEFDANWKPCPPAFFFCSFFCLRPRTVSSTSSNSFHGHVPRLRTGGYFTLVPHLRSDSSQNFLSLFQKPRTKWRRNFKGKKNPTSPRNISQISQCPDRAPMLLPANQTGVKLNPIVFSKLMTII